jgi:hypothetical protein
MYLGFSFMNLYTEIYQEFDNEVKISRYICLQGSTQNLFQIFMSFVQFSMDF